MSELRQNLASKEWYVIATERAKRPSDFRKTDKDRENYEYSENCPFCAGNEHMIENASYELVKDGKWVIKSIPNKFSALSPIGDRQRQAEGIYRKMRGVGIHEVIIESPLHNDFYTKMLLAHIEDIIRTYLNRYKASIKDDRIEAVILFKNYGESAGSSLSHPHSQMIAVPVVPAGMRNRLEAAKRYFDDTGQCVFCVMMNEEIRENERIITENGSFVAFCPFASGSPFESWIVPRRHNPDFSRINESEIKDLAAMMKDLFSRYYYGLKDPDFNFVIKTPPRDESNDRSFHWYIQILPKLTKIAGFELGSGMLINVALPEECANFLKSVAIPEEMESKTKTGSLI